MTQKQPGQPSRFWLAFAQDSFEIPIVLAFALYGLVSFFFSDLATPPSVETAITWTLIIVWHGTMALGGILGALGRIMEWERVEISGLFSLGFSCALYLLAAIPLGAAAFGLMTLLVAVLAGCIARGFIIRKSLKGQSLAHNIVEIVRHNGNGDQL